MEDVTVATFNVNGLRSILARRGTARGIGEFLDSLQADILCFQETKLTHQDLKQLQALACVPGWTSYFSFCRDKSGYAGVATFCRAATAAARPGAVDVGGTPLQAAAAGSHPSNHLHTRCHGSSSNTPARSSSHGGGGCVTPLAAQEGLMGICPPQSPAGAAAAAGGQEQLLLGPWEELRSRFTWRQAVAMDAQGRALITDHGAFVLFNLYLPATTDPTSPRFQVKLHLLEALQLWCTALTAAGRHVMVVGDLNICAHPQDHCDFRMAPAAVQARYRHNRLDRAWLQQHITCELVPPSPTPAAATAPPAITATEGMPKQGGSEEAGPAALPEAAAPPPRWVFLDSWRALHPNHTRPFTVWNWKKGVRNDKHASRVDYILVADGAPEQHSHRSSTGPTQQQPPSSPRTQGTAAHARPHPQGVAISGHSSSDVVSHEGWSLAASLREAAVWRDFSGSDHAPVKVVLRGVPHQLLHPPGWAGHPPSLAAENLFVQGLGALTQPRQRLITSLFQPVNRGSGQGSREQVAGAQQGAAGPVGTILEALLNSTAMAALEAAAKQKYRANAGSTGLIGGGMLSGTADEAAAAAQLGTVPMSSIGCKRPADVAGLDTAKPCMPDLASNVTQPWQQQQHPQVAPHAAAVTSAALSLSGDDATDHGTSRGGLWLPPLPAAAPTGAVTSDSSDEEHVPDHQQLRQQQEAGQQQQAETGASGRRVLRASGVRCWTAAGTVRLRFDPHAGPSAARPPGG